MLCFPPFEIFVGFIEVFIVVPQDYRGVFVWMMLACRNCNPAELEQLIREQSVDGTLSDTDNARYRKLLSKPNTL